MQKHSLATLPVERDEVYIEIFEQAENFKNIDNEFKALVQSRE